MTHLRNPILRLPLMTAIHDSCPRPPFATHCFATTLSCDPTTDGQTVSTPQRHLPSIPTLTLIKKFGTFSTAWPPPLATAHHHVHHLQRPFLTLPLAYPLLQRPLPPPPPPPLSGPLPTSPPLSHPLPLPSFPLYGNMSLQFQ